MEVLKRSRFSFHGLRLLRGDNSQIGPSAFMKLWEQKEKQSSVQDSVHNALHG